MHKRCATCHKEFSPYEAKTIIKSSEMYSYAVCYNCKPKEKAKGKLPSKDPNKCSGCGKEFTSDVRKYTITKGDDEFNLCYKCCRG